MDNLFELAKQQVAERFGVEKPEQLFNNLLFLEEVFKVGCNTAVSRLPERFVEVDKAVTEATRVHQLSEEKQRFISLGAQHALAALSKLRRPFPDAGVVYRPKPEGFPVSTTNYWGETISPETSK